MRGGGVVGTMVWVGGWKVSSALLLFQLAGCQRDSPSLDIEDPHPGLM